MTYKISQKNYSFYELIDIFPEAKLYIKNKLIREIKQCKNDLCYAKKLRTEYQKVLSRIYRDKEFWTNVVEVVWISPWTEGREKKIKQNTSYLQSLREKSGWQEVDEGKITDIDIQKAKQFSIDSLMEFNKADFSPCPFHKETQGSFKYYRKTNSWWCFSCQTGGDSISLYMKLNNCGFRDAVKKLINK